MTGPARSGRRGERVAAAAGGGGRGRRVLTCACRGAGVCAHHHPAIEASRHNGGAHRHGQGEVLHCGLHRCRRRGRPDRCSTGAWPMLDSGGDGHGAAGACRKGLAIGGWPGNTLGCADQEWEVATAADAWKQRVCLLAHRWPCCRLLGSPPRGPETGSCAVPDRFQYITAFSPSRRPCRQCTTCLVVVSELLNHSAENSSP